MTNSSRAKSCLRLVCLAVLSCCMATLSHAAETRIAMSVTLPGGGHVGLVETSGEMASITTESFSLGRTPIVRGDLVAIWLYLPDDQRRPGEKALGVLTGEIGQEVTFKPAWADEPIRIVPTRVY